MQRLSVRRQFLFGDGVEKINQCPAIFGEHPQELDAITELRVACDDSAGDEKSAAGFKFEIEARACREWVHALDVASTEAQVGGSTVQGSGTAFGVNFDRHVDFVSRGLPPFRDHGPTSQSTPPSLREV